MNSFMPADAKRSAKPLGGIAFVKTRKVRVALAFLVTSGIVYFAVQYISLRLIEDVFRQIQWTPAALAIVTYGVITAIRAWRFRLAGADAPSSALFRIAAIHAALLRIMPLRSGELAYGFLLRRTSSGGMAQGIATIIVLRILDVIVIIPLAAMVVFTWATGATSNLVIVGLGLAFFMSLVGFFAMGALGKFFERRFVSGGPVADTTVEQATRLKLAKAVLEVTELSHVRRLVLLGITLLLWTVILLWFYLSLLAVGAVDSLADGIRVSILGITGSIVPLSLIGSFGPMESGFAWGMRASGQSIDLAATNALVVSGLTFLANWVLAIPCLLTEMFIRR